MKKLSSIIFLVLFGQIAYAGNFFQVISSGQPASAEITLCLNGSGPYTCQNYAVTGKTLNIRTLVPNHNYPHAGIKILTPNYFIEGCTLNNNGYCVFPVSNTNPVNFHVIQLFTIGGSVSGYTNSGLRLQNNGTDTLKITANGTFTFAQRLATGASYNVTILSQPVGQVCNVNNGTGTVTTEDITDISVSCVSPSSMFTIVTSSLGNGTITPNGSVSVASGGSQTFIATPDSGYVVNQWLLDGVVVQTGGTTYQLTNITANHTLQASFTLITYTVGGSVAGYTSSGLVLLNNSGDSLPISANGNFTFSTPLADGSSYNVTVGTQPSGQSCSVTNASGTISGADVTNVSVTCSGITHTITVAPTTNGSVSPNGSVVVNDGANQLFTATPDLNYTVGPWFVDGFVVQTGGTTYTLTNITADHTLSTLFFATYTVGGTVSGYNMGGGLSLQLTKNGAPAEVFPPFASGSYTFMMTRFSAGDSYAVTVLFQPASQFCFVTNGSGMIMGMDVTNADITCV